ncbi:MAG: hypothetical protein OWR52_05135 [Acidibacillus sp.]|nr:hypothetical protein [Sulfoacidibacillus ferrooxidans]MCY0892879.1 hypothetical protein [Acidibacillus sp.]
MNTLDPRLLHVFRAKMANPVYWRRVHSCLRALPPDAVATPDGCAGLVDHLCGVLGVSITPAQRAGAIQWLAAQRLNPQNPNHHWRMWHYVYG